jgi:quinol monooxygenase YgiN
MESLKISIYYHQDKKKELLRTCQSIADQASLETDCLQSRIEEDSDIEKTILLTQVWQSWPVLNTYFSSDQFRALLGAMKLFGRSYEIQINGTSRDITEIEQSKN